MHASHTITEAFNPPNKIINSQIIILMFRRAKSAACVARSRVEFTSVCYDQDVKIKAKHRHLNTESIGIFINE